MRVRRCSFSWSARGPLFLSCNSKRYTNETSANLKQNPEGGHYQRTDRKQVWCLQDSTHHTHLCVNTFPVLVASSFVRWAAAAAKNPYLGRLLVLRDRTLLLLSLSRIWHIYMIIRVRNDLMRTRCRVRARDYPEQYIRILINVGHVCVCKVHACLEQTAAQISRPSSQPAPPCIPRKYFFPRNAATFSTWRLLLAPPAQIAITTSTSRWIFSCSKMRSDRSDF